MVSFGGSSEAGGGATRGTMDVSGSMTVDWLASRAVRRQATDHRSPVRGLGWGHDAGVEVVGEIRQCRHLGGKTVGRPR